MLELGSSRSVSSRHKHMQSGGVWSLHASKITDTLYYAAHRHVYRTLFIFQCSVRTDAKTTRSDYQTILSTRYQTISWTKGRRNLRALPDDLNTRLSAERKVVAIVGRYQTIWIPNYQLIERSSQSSAEYAYWCANTHNYWVHCPPWASAILLRSELIKS